ncbi:unnamed protein product [Rodentolepis nana]|uniref:MAM domain-containing protein n=1 Tax=Rodentolepis nana TaxID=102285 RepID=A0A3P7VNE5_RODNA|nr:unnamed protein product [Rodentolepis nana]
MFNVLELFILSSPLAFFSSPAWYRCEPPQYLSPSPFPPGAHSNGGVMGRPDCGLWKPMEYSCSWKNREPSALSSLLFNTTFEEPACSKFDTFNTVSQHVSQTVFEEQNAPLDLSIHSNQTTNGGANQRPTLPSTNSPLYSPSKRLSKYFN